MAILSSSLSLPHLMGGGSQASISASSHRPSSPLTITVLHPTCFLLHESPSLRYGFLIQVMPPRQGAARVLGNRRVPLPHCIEAFSLPVCQASLLTPSLG